VGEPVSRNVDEPAYRAVTFEAVRDAYAHQMRALREGGVDFFLIETVFDSLNAKAAIVAALGEAPDVPLWLSFTAVDKSGRNLSGQTAEAFWISVEHARPLVVGVNCSLGAADMRPFVEDISKHATTWVSCYPNAGLPNEFGGYDEQPHDTSSVLGQFARDGLVKLQELVDEPGFGAGVAMLTAAGMCRSTTAGWPRPARATRAWLSTVSKSAIPTPTAATKPVAGPQRAA